MILNLLAVLLTIPALLTAEKHALLIGIGEYIPGQGIATLEGPGPDVEAVATILKQHYSFLPENITTLVNSKAGRQAIVDAIDALIARVKPGDYVVIYYSGHGTSPQDPAWKQRLPVDADTGAIIPADYKRAAAYNEVSGRLVVGRRDLRPRLAQLDNKATVLLLADTCFSQNLAKSVIQVHRGTPRSVSARDLVLEGSSLEDDAAADLKQIAAQVRPAPFPYNTITSISAALAGEPAIDVDSRMLKENPRATFDGKPHGQFTSALVVGLRGAADRNHDGTISHAELYEYLSDTATKDSWRHQPALSANEKNDALMKSAVLGGPPRGLTIETAPSHAGKIRVSVEGLPEKIRSGIASIPGLEAGEQNSNLLVRRAGAGYRIHASNGIPFSEDPLSEPEMLARLKAEPDLRALVTWSYPKQSLNAELSFWAQGGRLQQGVLIEGNQFEVHTKIDEPAWPLVVNVDLRGVVTVLYPLQDTSIVKGVQGEQNLGLNFVACPCGMEYLKAFVFRKKPAGYDTWGGKHFEPSSPELQQLLSIVRQGDGETTLRVVTNSKSR